MAYTLGQRVAKGDILRADQQTSIADRTTIAERAGELEQLISVAEVKLRRLRPLASEELRPVAKLSTPRRSSRAADVAMWCVTPDRAGSLLAPIDGVIGSSRVVSGKSCRLRRSFRLSPMTLGRGLRLR
jgi:hypothetical protein